MNDVIEPSITVLMPCYNGARTLQEAIDSVRTQSYADWELVVIDDGSSDASRTIAETNAAADSRIKVYSQSNQGIVVTLNRGLGVARGRYVARLDCDDIAEPERLTQQYQFMQSHLQCALVGSFYTEIPAETKHRMPTGALSIREFLRHNGNAFVHSSVMMRLDVCRALGGYRANFPFCEDYDLWLRISEHHHVENIPEYLVRYRRHAESLSLRNIEQQALSAFAVRRLAALRRNGDDEPDIGVGPVTVDTLSSLGCSIDGISEHMIQWIKWNQKIVHEQGAPQEGQALFDTLIEKYSALRREHAQRGLMLRRSRGLSSAYF